jgi:hypothetical protein
MGAAAEEATLSLQVFAGIVAIYQKHCWLAEMREAVKLWEQRLSDIVAPGLDRPYVGSL